MQCLGAKMSYSFSRLALRGVALAKEGIQCSMSPFREFRLGVLSLGCAVSVSCDWCSLVGSFSCATIQRTLCPQSCRWAGSGVLGPGLQGGRAPHRCRRVLVRPHCSGKGKLIHIRRKLGAQDRGASERLGWSQSILMI